MSVVLAELVLQREATAPLYDPGRFRHWVDADGDGCDTREEVLLAEAVGRATVAPDCSITSGSWSSPYDGEALANPGDADVDHVVDLAEAWRSGAHAWTDEQREAFANDLGYARSLIVVTDDVDASKADLDPGEWVPPAAAFRCEYLAAWAVVKWRWNLAVDSSEWAVLNTVLGSGCSDLAVELPPKADVPPPAPPGPPFTDVSSSHPFLELITWLAATGITTGYPDGTFRPGVPITREAFAAYLYRYTWGPHAAAPACNPHWFDDVSAGNPFCGHITWLAGTGITTGYPDGGFHPGSHITREAVAVMLQRYRATEAPTSTTCDPTLFRDLSGSTFCGVITWLAGARITTGYPDGTFRPADHVTREAVAAYVYRYHVWFGPSHPPTVVSPPAGTPPTPPQPPPALPPNPGDTRDCEDFATWPEAQAWFDAYWLDYGDVAHLDGDRDLVACDDLPGAP